MGCKGAWKLTRPSRYRIRIQQTRDKTIKGSNPMEIINQFIYTKRLYSKKETATLLNCSTKTIDNYVGRQLLKAHRASRYVMFTPESIEQFLLKYQR
jgi:hypothetical protein